MEKLDEIVQEALKLFAGIDDPAELEQVKARYLGKEGASDGTAEGPRQAAGGGAPGDGRQSTRQGNARGGAVGASRCIQRRKLEAQLAQESLDVTLPGRGIGCGGLHPVTRTLERIEEIVPFDWFCRGRRPRDRDRFLQFHRAEPAGKSSGACHARHVLPRRRQACAAHAYLADPDPLHGERTGRRCASSRRAVSIASIPMPRIRRCSIRSKDCGSTSASALPTSKA